MDKNETQAYIDITPHRSLMVKVGQTGYSLQEALSELIDNSIDARLENSKLKIELKLTEDSILIKDNGTGMSEEEAMSSIRLGFSDKKEKLGEFGLGLKTASTFLGKKFTIITTRQGNKDEYVLTFDEDEWLEKGEWHKYPFKIHHDTPSENCGTTIIIESLKVKLDDRVLQKLKMELSERFAPFIKNNEIVVTINGEEIVPNELQLLGEKNFFEINKGECKVKGWWSYKLRGLNKDLFGFNTFRRGRLVTVYDKIGLNPNQDVKQIIGEVEIFGVKVTHDKRAWQKDDNYKQIENELRIYFKDYEPRLKKLLSGYPASSGLIEGTVKRLNMFIGQDIEAEMIKVARGDILVTEMTRPQFILAIRRAGAIVTDLGGTLSHAAIVAREFDIPAVIGTQNATKILKDGQKVIVDGNNGIVYEV